MFAPVARVRQLALAQVQRFQKGMMPELHVEAGGLFEVPELLGDLDVECAMVVTTQGFVERGTIAPFANALLTKGITSAVFADVEPDPSSDCIQKAAAFYARHECDAMVAIGGGSVIDCAKLAGALVARPGKTALDLAGLMKVRRQTPLLVAVPTTAGTGSEATATAVVTDSATQQKHAVSDLALIPDIAVLDASLLVGLPPAMTAYSGMDAIVHAVEAYVNRFASRDARKYSELAVDAAFTCLKASYDNPKDLGYREGMLLAAHWAGIAFTNAFVGYAHALAHAVGARYHVQHGMATSVFLPIVLEAYGQSAHSRLARLAEVVGLDGNTDAAKARAFIAAIRSLSSSMGVPLAIPSISEQDIPDLARVAESEANPDYPVPVVLGCVELEEILRIAKG